MRARLANSRQVLHEWCTTAPAELDDIANEFARATTSTAHDERTVMSSRLLMLRDTALVEVEALVARQDALLKAIADSQARYHDAKTSLREAKLRLKT